MQPGDQPGARAGLPLPLFPARSFAVRPACANGDRPANPAAPRQDRKPASPFDLDQSDQSSPVPRPMRRGPGGPGRRALASAKAVPSSRHPTSPFQLGGARTSRYTRDEQTDPREDDGPLLALPDVTLPPVAGADAAFGTQPAQTGSMTADAAPLADNPPASAPRRGFLSGLFNNLGLNWTRR